MLNNYPNYIKFIDVFSLNINRSQGLHVTHCINLNGTDFRCVLSIIKFNNNIKIHTFSLK